MKNTYSYVLILFILISFVSASEDLHNFVRQITESSIRDYYYRSEDPSWDPLKFHKGKNREENTTGHDSAKTFIQATLESYLGVGNVYVHEFDWSRGKDDKGYNIIGVKEGLSGSSSDVWVLGAHYDSYDSDHTGTAPGANDNGSGMVSVLEMARIVNTRESDATILFCLWDGEEPDWISAGSFGSSSYSGPSGSRAWINAYFTTDPARANGDTLLWSRVKGNINMDMFGYPASNNTLWLYHGGDEWNNTINGGISYPTPSASNTLYLDAEYYLENYGCDDQNPRNYVSVVGKGTMQYSDNISFSRAGIPSLEYAESDWGSDTHYHKWSDYYRPASGDANFLNDENPQIGFLSMVTRGAVALLADTANVALSETGTPVSLTYFKAASGNKRVILSWQTESEIENLGFILEKRNDRGDNWKSIASYLKNEELIGQGFSTESTDYIFEDSLVFANQQYEYRLSEVNFSGKISRLKSTSVLYIDMERNDNTLLKGNAYPNPFNPSLTIEYALERDAEVSVKVFDLAGREVVNLQNKRALKSGRYDLRWHANKMPSGIYLVQVLARYSNKQCEAQVMKLILNK